MFDGLLELKFGSNITSKLNVAKENGFEREGYNVVVKVNVRD